MLSVTARMPFRALVFSIASAPIIRIVFSENTLPNSRFFTKSLPAAESLSSPSRNPATSFRPITPLSTKRVNKEFIADGLLKNASRLPLPSISDIIVPISSVESFFEFATACCVLPCAFFSFLLNLAKVAVSYFIGSSLTSTRRGCFIPLCSICSAVKP